MAAVRPAAAFGCRRWNHAALVRSDKELTRQSFALTRFASDGGFAIGPPLGALIAARFSYDRLFVAGGIGTLLFALCAARILPARGDARSAPAHDPDAPGLWRELRARPAVLVLLAAIVLLVGAGLLLVGLGYAVLIPGTGVLFAVAMMLSLTLGEILYKTPATAYVADQAPGHAQGRFQSLYAGASISGQVLAPPLGAALYAAAPALLWPLCALLAAGAGGAVLAARRLPGPGERARATGKGPHAETGSPERAPAG